MLECFTYRIDRIACRLMLKTLHLAASAPLAPPKQIAFRIRGLVLTK